MKTMNDDEFEEMRRQANELRVRVRDEEERRRSEIEYPKLKKLIGTFWKYRNCYSCPKGPEDYWFIYRYVVWVDTDCTVHTREFQVDKDGKLSFDNNKSNYLFSISDSGWLPSSKTEWKRAVKAADRKWAALHDV